MGDCDGGADRWVPLVAKAREEMRASEMPWRAMALNNAWANATLYRAVQSLPEAGFTAKRPGFFGSLSATMNHIYEVDLYYIDALEAGGTA